MKKRIVNILLIICVFMSIFPRGIETKGVESSKKENKYGYVDSGLKIYEQPSSYVKDTGNLPSRFDLREENGVTSVKNQNPYGTCWAFATMASVESNFKYTTGKDVDLSEINLALDRVGVNGLNAGGNFIMSSSYFANGRGPVLEKDDPYPSNGESPVNRNAKATYNVMNSLYLPSRKNSLDNNNIKEAIINNGAVAISYNHSQEYLAYDGVSYYYNGGISTNHAVALVGWDDNYPKEKFKNSPPGNGAFIVKNSWGNDWGENGYFYISYYDTSLGSNLILTTDKTEWLENIDNKYTYAKYSLASPNDLKTVKDQFMANVNVAKNNELLSALSMYTYSTNVYYEIYIDEDYSEANYPNGDISYILNKKRKSGTLQYAGLNNIKFDMPTEVQAGKRFMVAVKYRDVFRPYLEFSSNDGDNNSFSITNNKLEKRYSANPLAVYSYDKSKESATSINVDKTSVTMKMGEKSQVKANLVGSTYTDEKLKWTSSNPKVAVVDEDGLVTGRGNGNATITVSNRSETVKKTINVSINTNLSVVKDFNSIDNDEKSIVFDDAIDEGVSYPQIQLVDDDGNAIPISTRIDNKNLYIKVKLNSKKLVHATLMIPKDAIKNKVNRGLSDNVKIGTVVNSYDKTDKVTLGSKDIMKSIAEQLGKSESEITSGDISSLVVLSLYCDNVDFKDIGLLSSLTDLDVHSNGNEKNLSDLKNLKNLKSVNFHNISIVNLNYLKNNSNLTSLIAIECNLFSLDGMENFSNLNYAYLGGNYIYDIKGVGNLNKLQSLSLNNNQITDISMLANCKELTDLNISNNKVTSLNGIQNLTKLSRLYGWNNHISSLKELEKCTSLKSMNFDSNDIEDLTPIKSLSEGKIDTKGMDLSVSNNHIDINDPILKYLKDSKGYSVFNNGEKGELYEINGFSVSNNNMNSKNDLTLTFNKDIDKSWNIEFYKNDSKNNKINLPFSISENKIYVDNKLDTEGNESKYKIHCNIDYTDSNGAKQTINTDIYVNRTGFYTEDINKDKTVDIKDLAEVASHYNESAKGEIDNWQYDKDINLDGVIDLYDLVDIARAM